MLGFGDKALELYRMINPIEHARTKEASAKYKVEPYVIPADIYGTGNLAGRGGWTWYTGSSSWYYKAGIEYILGLQIEKGILKIIIFRVILIFILIILMIILLKIRFMSYGIRSVEVSL